MDDDPCFMLDERDEDPLFITYYVACLEVKSNVVYIVEEGDFDEKFIPINTDNFDEIHKWYGFDELTTMKIKKEMFKIEM